MGKTLRIAFALRNTYQINAILYALRQIPLVKRLLPVRLYGARWPRVLAAVLSLIWELAGIFLWKALYLGWMVGAAAGWLPGDPAANFLHILLFLTVIGAFFNTYLFDPTRDKYYAMLLLRMDARQYTLVQYGYATAKQLLGLFPTAWFAARGCGVPAGLCLLIPLYIVGAKAVVAAWSLWDFERKGYPYNENRLKTWTAVGALFLLALAYGLPALGRTLPLAASGCTLGAVALAGLVCQGKILSFRQYFAMYKQLLFDAMPGTQSTTDLLRQQSRKAISLDSGITSRKAGFAYLNELFIRRHRRILWRPALRQTAVLSALAAAGFAAVLLSPAAAEAARELLSQWLPYFVFILYALNRGSSFTQALYRNCDCSLLTYPFFKEPRMVLRLFALRLGEIVKVNLLPASVLGAGLGGILALSGGSLRDSLVLLLAPPAMSVFFSVHYLTIYYLLQPYNAATELKGGTYRLVTSATYFVCLLLMQARMDTLVFGVLCLVFCVVYCAVACALVYRYAPRTFRIRT